MNTIVEPTYRAVFAVTFARFFSPFTLFVWLALWVTAVMAGPFGTYETMSVTIRVVYWGVIAASGITLGYTSFALTLCCLKSERNLAFPLLGAGVMTLIYAPFVAATQKILTIYSISLKVSSVAIIINIFVITAAVFIFRRFLWAGPQPRSFDQVLEVRSHEENPSAPEPRLMRRLPEGVKGPVLRLSANDHHVEVVTSNGHKALRMRMLDAIDEMEPVQGMCVHRSHWVALDAIARVEKINAHKICVHLINGDEIPVSRKYRDHLVKAGLVESFEVV